MIYTLRCWGRLGDILLCFPATKFLHTQGHEVFIECAEAYHDIFKCVDYVTPVPMFNPRGETIVMGVHPTSGGTVERYAAYRKSGKKWQRWVYDQNDVLRECSGGPPQFTKLGHAPRQYYGLPSEFILAAPFGYSQVVKWPPKLVTETLKARHPGMKLMVLNDAVNSRPTNIRASRLSHLPDIISWAHDFATINSAGAIVAAGLGRPYLHFPQTGDAAQDCSAYLSPKSEIYT